MAEKMLNTRIQLRYDLLSTWEDKNPLLKTGEVAIAYLATSEMKDGTTGTQHPVLFKVGPGNFNSLPFVSALAADVYGWAKKSETEFTTWVKGLIEVTDIDAYSKGEVDNKLSANSAADQKYAKDYADALIAGLDATASQTAGADGLALSVTEVDGKITAISGSIAANTYDAYGSAAAAESAAKSHAESKAAAAESAAKSHAETKASEAQAAAEATAAGALSAAKTELEGKITKAQSDAEATAAADATSKANAAQAAAEATAAADATAKANAAQSAAEATAANALSAARTEINGQIATAKSDAISEANGYTDDEISAARTEITKEISDAISTSATAPDGVISNVIAKADAAQEAADEAMDKAEEGVTKAEAAAIAAEAAQKTIDDFLEGGKAKDTLDTLIEIQGELERLGEAVELETQFAAKADKVTGATADNLAGLDANGNLKDSGIAASTVALKSEVNGVSGDVSALATRVKAIEDAPYATQGDVQAVDNKFANYNDKDAVANLLSALKTEVNGYADGKASAAETAAKSYADGVAATAKSEAIADAATKYETIGTAQGIVNNLKLGETYEPIGAETRAIAAAKTETEKQVKALSDGAVATNTSGISSINALLATYGDIVTHNVAEFATAAQGAKADTALQEITTTANGGLKVTNKNQIDIDTTVTFVFNCGGASLDA